ncbi:MAG: transglycosylase SLT domain-containing protein [Duncaniella sp.]|nr:transglycosylase SLT domain-containing protein [Duncaniella sp.]
MRHSIFSLLAFAVTALSASGAPSILDLKHSLTDDHIIAPESFETRTQQLEENFYLKNFVVPGLDTGNPAIASPAVYEERLKKLPTQIELPYNSVVGNYINMYLNKRRGLVADMLALHNYYGRFFEEELLKEGMPLELEYLPVIESAINPNAVSRAGAVGLWQFMPATAKGLGMEINSLVDERRDPRISSRNAARYLKQLYEIYKDWSLAIAAYNCGPGNVNKALRRAGAENDGTGAKKDFWQIYEYLPAETRGYVPAFIAANYVMNYYPHHGITPTVVKRQLTTDTVMVNKYVHFNQIASVLNLPIEEIRMLNPQYRADVIPGDYHPYALTLPTQQCLSYIMSEKNILDYDRELYARRSYVEPGDNRAPSVAYDANGNVNLSLASGQSQNADANQALATTQASDKVVRVTHTVSRGENLRDIARQYGVSATDIKRWNSLRAGKVKEGDQLVIEKIEHTTPDEVRIVSAPTVAAVVDNNSTSGTEPNQTVTPAPKQSTSKNREQPKPATNTQRTTAAKTTIHNIKQGDTLASIARKYGTTVEAIQTANGMKKTNTAIRAGETLKIPAKGGSVSSSPKKSSGSTAKKGAKRRR